MSDETRLYGQRDVDIANLIFGSDKSDSKIGPWGCYFISVINGLRLRGLEYTPQSFNQLLKDRQVYTGPYFNYLGDDIAQKVPDVFELFKSFEPWPGQPELELLLSDPGYIVVCRVSGKAIGGSGNHFVLLYGYDDGAVIHDPWTNTIEDIGKKYGKYGGVLGLRVYKITETNQTGEEVNSMDVRPTFLKTLLQEVGVETQDKDEGSIREQWHNRIAVPVSQYQNLMGEVQKLSQQAKTYNGQILSIQEANAKTVKQKDGIITELEQKSKEQLLAISQLQEQLTEVTSSIKEDTLPSKLKSRKLAAAVAGIIVTLGNRWFNIGLTTQDVTQILLLIGTYIFAQGVVDTAKEKKGTGNVLDVLKNLVNTK